MFLQHRKPRIQQLEDEENQNQREEPAKAEPEGPLAPEVEEPRRRQRREVSVEMERVPEAPPKRKHAEMVVQPILDAPVPAVERMRQKLLAADAVSDPHPALFIAKAILLLLFGLALSIIFADAALTASTDLSSRLNAHPFYVPFVAFPVAINVADFFVSFSVAARKRRTFTTLAFANLYNSATLNNLVGLGVFCLTVYLRGLGWTFSAETCATLLFACCVGLLGSLARTIPLWVGFPVAASYVLSLVAFRFLEHYAKWT